MCVIYCLQCPCHHTYLVLFFRESGEDGNNYCQIIEGDSGDKGHICGQKVCIKNKKSFFVLPSSVPGAVHTLSPAGHLPEQPWVVGLAVSLFTSEEARQSIRKVPKDEPWQTALEPGPLHSSSSTSGFLRRPSCHSTKRIP